jgi:hypothetical protein
MTPKEKAKELYDKYGILVINCQKVKNDKKNEC